MCRSTPPRPAPRAAAPATRAASDLSSVRSAPPASRARSPETAAGARPPCQAGSIPASAILAPSEHPSPRSPPASGQPLAPTCPGPELGKNEPANLVTMASSILASSPVASLNHKSKRLGIPNDSLNCGKTLAERRGSTGPNERLIAIVGRLGVRPVVRLSLPALSPLNYQCFLRQDRRSDQGVLHLKSQKMPQIRELATTGHAKCRNCRSRNAEFCGLRTTTFGRGWQTPQWWVHLGSK